MSDPVSEAAARLEQAVERLAAAMARPRVSEGVAPERLAELSGRLDATLQRLRGALVEMESAEADDAAGLAEDGIEIDGADDAMGDPAPRLAGGHASPASAPRQHQGDAHDNNPHDSKGS